ASTRYVSCVGFTFADVIELTLNEKLPAELVPCSTIVTFCGVFPGPRPATITYKTAARTTVIATIKMVPITGDTAALFFRPKTVFMWFCPPQGLSASLDHYSKGII